MDCTPNCKEISSIYSQSIEKIYHINFINSTEISIEFSNCSRKMYTYVCWIDENRRLKIFCIKFSNLRIFSLKAKEKLAYSVSLSKKDLTFSASEIITLMKWNALKTGLQRDSWQKNLVNLLIRNRAKILLFFTLICYNKEMQNMFDVKWFR